MTARPDRTYRDIPIPDHIWTAWDNPAGGAWRVGIDAALHHDTRTSRRINRANHIAAGIAAAAYFVGSIVNPRPIEIWRNCRAKKAAAKASVEEQRRREHRGRGER